LECEVLKVVEIGLLDINKVQPFIYNSAGQDYYALGDFFGKSYMVGRKK
jgi:hypothetical protein